MCTRELFEKISSMQQLEDLTLLRWDDIEIPVDFQNVTKFESSEITNNNPMNLHFPKLQELHLYSSYQDDWIEFLYTQPNLKRFNFHLKPTQTSPDDKLRRMASIFENLEKMFIYNSAYTPIAVDTIIEFIETNKQLKKLYLEHCTDTDKKMLKSKFPKEWTITNRQKGLSFER